MAKLIQFPFPIFITKEGKWYVAECSILGIATQGRSEKEAKENMRELIKDYLMDSDTPKVHLKEMAPVSLTYIQVPLAEKFLYGKT